MANAKMRRVSRANTLPNHFATLDLGNKKLACLIVENSSDKPIFIGGAIQQSRGIQDGAVSDMGSLERAIRIVVERAENSAERRVSTLILGVSGSNVRCDTRTSTLSTDGRKVSLADISKLRETVQKKIDLGKHTLLNISCTGYVIDDHTAVNDPVGMAADTVEARYSVISAPHTLITNLVECCKRAGLHTLAILPASTASGLGTLSHEEREEGAISIDIGAMGTSLAMFHNAIPKWQSYIPVGGQHVSRDLAHGLGTTLAAAERLKTLHGSVTKNAHTDRTPIEVATLGPQGRLESKTLPRGALTPFIEPRATELVDLIRRLLFSALQDQNWMPMRVVLTGGGAQLTGLDQLIQSRLNLPVRIGVPETLSTLGAHFVTPDLSRAAGLLEGLQNDQYMGTLSNPAPKYSRFGHLANAWRWLKENF